MLITLEPWEVEWAYHVGIRRHHANLAKGDAAHYDPQRMEDNQRASIAAASCELAVAKSLNLYWDGSVWDSSLHGKYKTRADVGTDVEVRRVRDRNNPLVVRKRDVERNRVIVSAFAVPPNFTQVNVIGWLPARDAWNKGDAATYDIGGTHLVQQEYLNPIEAYWEAA